MGEVQPRAGLEGRHRVLREGRAHPVPRAARLLHGRLRLHDLHRQLRPAAGGDLGGGRRGRPRRLRRALGQPQLRGAHPSRGEGELPRLAAARRRVRARRPDGHRPRRTSRSARAATATTSSCSDIWPTRARGAGGGRPRPSAARCSRSTYADVFTGDERWRELPVPGGRAVRVGAGLDLRAAAAVLRRTCRPSRGGFGDIAGARCLVMLGDSVTTDHISPAGAIKPDSPGGAVPDRARRRAEGLQLVRLAARQPRGDGARHVRERPPAEPARARAPRARGRCTCPRGEETTIYDASVRYLAEGTPLIVIAGKEYGSGSSRDWAAKGPNLLGVQRRDRRELRAHPPLEPADDGRAAAAVPRRRDAGDARPLRPRGVRDRGRRERRGARGDGARRRQDVHARASGSTRRASATTCATAGSSRSCSAACSPPSSSACAPRRASPRGRRSAASSSRFISASRRQNSCVKLPLLPLHRPLRDTSGSWSPSRGARIRRGR